MISSSDLRDVFLGFFSNKGHPILPSSSLIPNNDPTLLFVNAGMVQFKDVFIGKEQRPIKRATTAQKCVRAGGKHNDLDQVGYTARHHTFFEMLGNFSFGDYFKEEAILFAWEFLTKQIGLPKERLLVTIYHDDLDAAGFWKKISGLSDDKIIPISTNDNFWSMGDIGPCGPCSEIFYDHGEHIFGGIPGSATQDGDRFVEIWNLVFMQFEQLADGRKVPLPKPSIDTGMGLERLAAILQGVHDNYETDIMKSSVQDVNVLLNRPSGDFTPSHKVIADHIRSICFLLAEGITPSNEGRGYVLRRIIRRAIRHAQKLGASSGDSFLPKVAQKFIPRMSAHYRELEMFCSAIEYNLAEEEKRFQQTLENGLSILDKEVKKLSGSKILPGKIAFKLYDTYGFPLDLTEDILRDNSMSVDVEGFNKYAEKQKADAQKSWGGSGDESLSQTAYSLKQKTSGVGTVPLAYEKDEAKSSVLALLKDDQIVSKISQGDKGAIVTAETCFYGESGGQTGDIGIISSFDAEFVVNNTKKLENIIIHYGYVASGSFVEGKPTSLKVNTINRDKLRVNHSATHLLHSALRQELGKSVIQKGSLVSSDRLRFDFNYNSPLTDDNIHKIEALVNQWIRQGLLVSIDIKDKDEAIKSGAMALFGDKYGEKVRIVTMKDKLTDTVISSELCGGLHVSNTSLIGMFKIIEQSGIGSNVRRIEAIAGTGVFSYIANFENTIKDVCAILKCTTNELTGRCSSIVSSLHQLERENVKLKQQQAHAEGSNETVSVINGIQFLGKKVSNLKSKDLRTLMDQLRSLNKTKSIIVLANINDDNKVSLLIGVSEDIKAIYPANLLIQKVIEIIGGTGGGGRPDFAQGGGDFPSKVPEALEKIKQLLIAK